MFSLVVETHDSSGESLLLAAAYVHGLDIVRSGQLLRIDQKVLALLAYAQS